MWDWLKKILGLDLLEQRVAKLEDKILQDAQAVEQRIAAAVTQAIKNLTYESPDPIEKLTLTSPNGKQTISLMAHDDIAGLWIGGPTGEPMIAIYKDHLQGACIGLWGPADPSGDRRGGLDAAMHYDASCGGCVQLIDPENEVHTLTGELVPGAPTGGVVKFAMKPAPVGSLPPV